MSDLKPQREIPEGKISIPERIAQGGNPPPHVRADPEKYYYDPESKQYQRRPEPIPDFSASGGEREIPCFPKGTLIVTASGLVPIESLTPYMTILSFNEADKTICSKSVIALLRSQTVHLVKILTSYNTIYVTRHHRFWVEDKKQWIAAKYLEPGMLLWTLTEGACEVKNIDTIIVVEQDTYNLTVADFNTYFVGAEGFLVHNAYVIPMGKIYVGRDPEGNIIYVGKTKQDLLDRESQHHDEGIKEPKKYGFKINMKLEVVIDGLTDDQMYFHERRIYDELGGKDKLNNIIEPMGDEKINQLIEKYC
jgi:Pretoxin HINT domain